jgi:tetratricopeptide (TPR) repeat protein
MAYFRALADAPSEQSSTWRCTLAGLVALRLIDAWATEAPLPDAGLRALERAINMMDVDAQEREPLRALREAMLVEARGRTAAGDSRVLERLREYGESLWLTAEWALASDACRTIIRHARTTSERAIVPLAYSRLGHCLLARGRQDAAIEVFQTARSYASARGDLRSDLSLRIAETTVEIQRGNYPAAECILDEVIAEATFAALPELKARAMHDRGGVAYKRGDFDRALALYFRALDEYGTDIGADRVLADIAIAVLELGHHDIAREVLQILERESIEQMQRWAAMVNLMRIAALDDNEPLFDGYRRKLARVRLPVRQRAYYHLFAAQGWLRFDQPSLARRELARVASAVRRHQLSELDEELSSALHKLGLTSATGMAPSDTPELIAVERESAARTTSDLQPLIDHALAAAEAWQRSRRSAPAKSRLAAGATA